MSAIPGRFSCHHCRKVQYITRTRLFPNFYRNKHTCRSETIPLRIQTKLRPLLSKDPRLYSHTTGQFDLRQSKLWSSNQEAANRFHPSPFIYYLPFAAACHSQISKPATFSCPKPESLPTASLPNSGLVCPRSALLRRIAHDRDGTIPSPQRPVSQL